MKRNGKRRDWLYAVLCLAFAGELMVAVDCVVVLLGGALSVKIFAILLAVTATVSYALCRKGLRRVITGGAITMTTAWLLVAVGFACWNSFSKNAVYQNEADFGKEAVYAGKRIMLIVPHEDDEINLLGGVTEEYVKYGSEVYAVFVTNGDSDFTADVRLGEGIAAMNVAGVPEDHIIFLGYGSEWPVSGPHIYNAEPNVVMESAAGSTKVYGMEDHPAYREGQDYTSENLLRDLVDVMLEYRPEVIFCSDHDYHIDHRAVSLAFEKAMGRMLNEQADYRPVVLKGYAYGTAWLAKLDYYTENLGSTTNVYEEPVLQKPEIYRWEERVRLPVQASALSRSAVSSRVYESLAMHKSQNATLESGRIINGDKVFWYRDTGSLLYSADLKVSSGEGELLRDFMLVDDHALADADLLPYDGVWIPEKADGQKQIRFSFQKPETINLLTFYDHPSLDDNILDMEIIFDDGTVVKTGALDPRGCASRLEVDKTAVNWMEIRIMEWEGERAGLSEVEAFADKPEHGLDFVKLMDQEENFAYDYWTKKDGMATFSLYVSGRAPAGGKEFYTVSVDNAGCTAVWDGEYLNISCPRGESAIVAVKSLDGRFSDSIVVTNPRSTVRAWNGIWQKAEEIVIPYFHLGKYQDMILYRVCSRLLG